jgi:hypothetical protein
VESPKPAKYKGVNAFYACSGKAGNPSGFAAWWGFLSGGGVCTEMDKVNSPAGDLLLNTTFEPFYERVRGGAWAAGILTPPCGQFNPRRIMFPHPRFPVMRTALEFGLGVAGLSEKHQRSVDAVNILAERVCLLARAMFNLRRPWVIENPPSRGQQTGIFARFYRVALKLHASFFDLPCVKALAAYTGALFVHLPMCHFGMPEQKYLTVMYPPYMNGSMQCLGSIRCHHTSHTSVTGGFDENDQPLGAETGIHPGGFSEALVRASLRPTTPCILAVDVFSGEDVEGLIGDRAGVNIDAVTRGKQGRQSSVTSRLVHDRFHRPAPMLRRLHYTCSDVPVSWTKLLSVEQSCDACLRAKAVHQHHDGTLPVVTKNGEIVAFDLWTTQDASILGGERTLFGVIDLYSDFSDVTRLKTKIDVPEAIGQFLAYCASVGVLVLRMHTDNEAIFHTAEAREKTRLKYAAQGILITTGCEYASRQNSKIERLWRTIAGDGRASLLNAPELDGSYYLMAVVDANQKRNVFPYADDNSTCPFQVFTGKKPSAAVFRVFGALAYVTLDHQLNSSASRLRKPGERAVPGIILGYGRDGTLRDRRRPGWVVHVPEYHMDKPLISPHVTILEYIRPSPSRLRQLTLTPPEEIDRTPLSLQIDSEGNVEEVDTPESADAYGDGIETPPPLADRAGDALALPIPTPQTISERLPRRGGSAYQGDARVVAPDVDVPVDDDVPTTAPEDGNISSRLTRNRTSGSEEVLLAASSWEFIGMATEHGSFDPSCPVDAYEIEVSHNKWHRAAPKLMAPLPPSTSASTIPVEFSGVACDAQVDFSVGGDTTPVLRNLSAGVPTNMVSYPWGNVPYEWCAGFDNLVLFHTEVDCGVSTATCSPPWRRRTIRRTIKPCTAKTDSIGTTRAKTSLARSRTLV